APAGVIEAAGRASIVGDDLYAVRLVLGEGSHTVTGNGVSLAQEQDKTEHQLRGRQPLDPLQHRFSLSPSVVGRRLCFGRGSTRRAGFVGVSRWLKPADHESETCVG